MDQIIKDWWARIRQHWRWALYLTFYKLVEERVLGWANSRIDENWGAIASVSTTVAELLPKISWIAIPVVIVALLIITWRETGRAPRPARRAGQGGAADPSTLQGMMGTTDTHLAGVLRTMMNEDLENTQRTYRVRQESIDWSGTKGTIGSKHIDFKFVLHSASAWKTELTGKVRGKLRYQLLGSWTK